MNSTQQIIAKKYARAWLNLFGSEMKKEDLSAFEDAASFLQQNPHLLFFLRLTMISKETKQQALGMINRQFSLPPAVDTLCKVLVKDDRASLSPLVLIWITRLFKRLNRIAQFIAESASPLSEHDNAIIRQFLASKTQCDIIYESKVNKDLIAGIRVQSKLWLWEHSLAQQLRRMRAAALQ